MRRFGTMKVFVSWSGDLSKKIAESIKRWLPCIIQSVDVFYSPEDIEKGENWDSKISKELSECKYGIICLTAENVTASWINFEAGAIAKSLDSHVATLMINISPSDIKGPLSRYQATKMDKDDFYQLVCNINEQCETPIKTEVLKTAFDGLWSNMITEIESIISTSKKTAANSKKSQNNSEAIEEILLLLRKQNTILSSPQQLLPEDYFEYINDRVFRNRNVERHDEFIYDILQYAMRVITLAESDDDKKQIIECFKATDLIEIIGHYVDRRTCSKQVFMLFRNVRQRYRLMYESYDRSNVNTDIE